MPELFLDFIVVESMYKVWFSEIRSHFCQHLFIGDTDIDGKAKSFPDAVLDLTGGGQGICIMGGNRGKVHIAFIHTDLLDVRADVRKMRHEKPAFLMIEPVVGRAGYEKRTFFQGITDGLAGADAVSLCGNGLCEHYAVAGAGVASYDGGNGAEI